ncbi:MAG: serine/threonine-protein kinase [Elusimicrobiota bacterium]|nr:serine/threonine-protein kinase [Elusimicrobiota bacterium]
MKKKSVVVDALLGLALTGFVAGSFFLRLPLLESVEFKAYDLRAKLRQNLTPPPEIVLVAIDDDSIAQLGRWPWPRTRMADAVAKLRATGPKVIGLNVLFSEAEQNQGLVEIRRLEGVYRDLLAAKKVAQKGVDFSTEFSSAAVALDSDSKLQAALAAAPDVVLPLFFSPGSVGAKPEPASLAVSSSAIAAPAGLEGLIYEETKMSPPVPAFSEAAAGLGHVNLYPDLDGVVRREAPLVKYGGQLYPSYALRLTMAYLGLKPEDLAFTPGAELKVGRLSVPLDNENMMAVTFNGPALETTRVVSFQDVMNDKVDASLFKDKIVIVGPTALGVATVYQTPVAAGFPSMEVVANVIENVLHQKFLTRPDWAENAEWGLIALMGLFIMFVLPRLKALWGLVVSIVLALGIMGAGTFLFTQGQWLKVGYPMVLLVAGYLVIISKGFLVTEKGKELVEASQVETNKMLGLSFQGQGMLDLAFEKFRLCPLDDNMKDTLYNLALDFERKRQFSKAAAVLDHVAAKDPKYKDIAEKTKMLKAASEGAVFGGVGGPKKDGTVMITGGSTKPTLGRYEIEKELGRGAMGVVYLGRDPKINRMVAIKTMMLEAGGDDASLKEVKERFFREAESAGTLNHPNIVRIFDAGDENEVAYIAMELLDGHDLVKYGTKDGLLPLEKALDYVATVADALDYAHAAGIVHRDIKPANIMLLKDGSIRVADFGIARISASSKTATGTVMGTPSYMSPEQVAGKKVDGRSDLFSLAVALFELTTGEKPFKGGEGIGTLLFQIANDPHPDPRAIRADLPASLKAVIDKGLAKKPEERFSRGSEMAAAIRAVIAELKGGAPAAAPAPAPAPVKTAEVTAPAPAPAPEPARTPAPPVGLAPAEKTQPPAPAPVAAPTPAVERTTPAITLPGLNDSPAAAARPATPASERTLGPTIPNWKMPSPKPQAAAAPAPAPAPAPADATMRLEPPQRAGAGAGGDVPPPPKKDAFAGEVPPPPKKDAFAGDAPPPPAPNADPGATLRIEPTQSPDATLRLKPHSQEPI